MNDEYTNTASPLVDPIGGSTENCLPWREPLWTLGAIILSKWTEIIRKCKIG